MDAILIADTPQYVEKSVLDREITGLKQMLGDINEKLDLALSRSSNAEKQSSDALELAKSERKERTEEIGALRGEMRDIASTTTAGFSSVYDKLNGLTGSIDRLGGKIDNWGIVNDSRELALKENRDRLERMETSIGDLRTDVELVTSTQASQRADMNNVNRALYGDQASPEFSFLGMLKKIDTSMTSRFDSQEKALTVLYQNLNKNIRAVESIQQERVQEKEAIQAKIKAKTERWESRKKIIGSILKTLANNKIILGVLGVSFLSLILASNDLEHLLTYIIQWLN